MIRSVKIKAFRGVLSGELEELTPLSVLVGPNGCGKSTVLDALLVGASPSPSEAIVRIVKRRSGVRRGARWLLWRGEESATAAVAVTTAGGYARQVEISVDPAVSEPAVLLKFSVTDTEPTEGARTLGSFGLRFTDDRNTHPDTWSKLLGDVPEVRLVEAPTKVPDTPLHQLYTKAVERGRRAEAKAMVGEVIPTVVDVEILTEGDRPIVYLVHPEYSIPAALAGDGTQSLLRLSFELTARSGGLVLLEEPEVHQHPGAIRQTVRAVWAAVRRDVQVILTTHSLELIDALLAEAKDDQELEKLSVYRLQRDEGLLKSHRDSGPQAALARSAIEDDLR